VSAVLDDLPIAATKTGMLASAEIAAAVTAKARGGAAEPGGGSGAQSSTGRRLRV
jgi:hydroxymethylpyrimidine/phosphomethylpyrimidine kinase